ncbi:MAG: type I secretion system permease/ATPase [Rickettsiales bacterium]|nr:type I secretion system permease/ATPase [Rickettsiales bacterium]
MTTLAATQQQKANPLVQGIRDCRTAFIITFMFAFGVNVLNLITPLYSLQVLDRVIGSGNAHTLLMLSVIIFFIYISHTLLQIARSFVLIKIGEWLDNKISPQLFSHAVVNASIKQSMGGSQIIREFNTIKSFLTSIGINSLFDAPWSVIYIAVIFMIHPYLGWLTIFGAILMLLMAFINAVAINSTLGSSTDYNLQGLHMAEIATRNAESVQAMGMMGAVRKRWAAINKKALDAQSVASYRNGLITNVTRFIRAIIAMAVTGIAAYIIISTHPPEMTVGNMIASSIMVSRALAPFDHAVEVWKQISSALKSYKKINSSLSQELVRTEGMSIPNPQGRLSVENVFFAHPPASPGEQPKYILKGMNFTLEPGKSLAIIGPSAAGKSTLARLLIGVWKPLSGYVRLDDADVYAWNREDFGKHSGYLPQGVELFSGTIKDNISRMIEDPDPALVVEAAKLAGAHEMISRMPKGYETDIGIAGSLLSGGQRQRIGLARAFFGNPKLVVLDEPNASLDDKGEQALIEAIHNTKNRGISTILISHRPSILSFVDMIMIIQDGMIVAYGPKDEVLAKLQNQAKNLQEKPQNQ